MTQVLLLFKVFSDRARPPSQRSRDPLPVGCAHAREGLDRGPACGARLPRTTTARSRSRRAGRFLPALAHRRAGGSIDLLQWVPANTDAVATESLLLAQRLPDPGPSRRARCETSDDRPR